MSRQALEALGMGRTRRGAALEPGDKVKVLVFSRWRSARVLRVAQTRALVEYVTPRGAKPRREAWFPISKMRRG